MGIPNLISSFCNAKSNTFSFATPLDLEMPMYEEPLTVEEESKQVLRSGVDSLVIRGVYDPSFKMSSEWNFVLLPGRVRLSILFHFLGCNCAFIGQFTPLGA